MYRNSPGRSVLTLQHMDNGQHLRTDDYYHCRSGQSQPQDDPRSNTFNLQIPRSILLPEEIGRCDSSASTTSDQQRRSDRAFHLPYDVVVHIAQQRRTFELAPATPRKTPAYRASPLSRNAIMETPMMATLQFRMIMSPRFRYWSATQAVQNIQTAAQTYGGKERT